MGSYGLTGKCFIVTGAASGIGLATANLLVKEGALVVPADVDMEGLENFKASLSPEEQDRILLQSLDVSCRKGVEALIKKTKTQFGRLDGIANVAGTGGRRFGATPIWEAETADFDFVMDINVRGLFNFLAEGLRPGVMNTPSAFVYVGSEYSVHGGPGTAIYAASKHAGLGMVKSAAADAGKNGTRVVAVLPGPTDTPNRRAALAILGADKDSTPRKPIPRPADPSEQAEVIAFLLSEKASFVTGTAWSVDGGSTI